MMSNLQQILQGCDTPCCLLVFVSVGQHFSMPRRSHYRRFIVIVSCSNEMCCRKREHMKLVHVQTRRRSRTPNHICKICLKVFAFPCELKRHTKTHEPGRGTRCKHDDPCPVCNKPYKYEMCNTLRRSLAFFFKQIKWHRSPKYRVAPSMSMYMF